MVNWMVCEGRTDQASDPALTATKTMLGTIIGLPLSQGAGAARMEPVTSHAAIAMRNSTSATASCEPAGEKIVAGKIIALSTASKTKRLRSAMAQRPIAAASGNAAGQTAAIARARAGAP